jgi:hypothetical protein
MIAFFKAAWRGDYSQGELFWAGLVLPIGLGLGLAFILPVFNLIQDQVISTRFWLIIAALFILLYLPWAFLISLRTIILHVIRLKESFIGSTLLILWCLTLVFTVYQLNNLVPTFERMAYIAFEVDDRQSTLTIDGNTLTIDGFVGYGDYSRVKNSMNSHTDVTLINLNLEGAHLHEARKIARLIAKKQLNTHVEEHCFQNCLIIYSGGYLRTARKTAQFNFEKYLGYANGYRSDWIIAREQEKDRLYFMKRGVTLKYSYKLFYGNADHKPFDHSVKDLRLNHVINRDLIS